MAINVFRFNPPAWAVVVENTFDASPELVKAKFRKEFLEQIKKMEKMPAVSIDDAANEAVRSNNA